MKKQKHGLALAPFLFLFGLAPLHPCNLHNSLFVQVVSQMLFEVEWEVMKMLFFNQSEGDDDEKRCETETKKCAALDDHVFCQLERVPPQEIDGNPVAFDAFDMAYAQQWGRPPVRLRAKCLRCGAIAETRFYQQNNSWSIAKLPKHRRCRL